MDQQWIHFRVSLHLFSQPKRIYYVNKSVKCVPVFLPITYNETRVYIRVYIISGIFASPHSPVDGRVDSKPLGFPPLWFESRSGHMLGKQSSAYGWRMVRWFFSHSPVFAQLWRTIGSRYKWKGRRTTPPPQPHPLPLPPPPPPPHKKKKKKKNLLVIFKLWAFLIHL